jgi:hypothetical protein
VLPPPDQGALAAAEARAKMQQEGMQRSTMGYAPMALPAPSPAMARAGIAAGAAPGMAPPLVQAELIAAETEDAATQVLFTAPGPVTLGLGETLSLPIVSRAVPVERLAFYQPSVNAQHPLAAVEMVNDTGAGLPPGVLTLYERGKAGASYVGDARLAPMPAGEKRLLSFAVDQKIAVERETKSRESVAQAKIARGVLTLSYRDEQTTVYRVKAAAGEERQLLIEHPRAAGWELAAPKAAAAELARGVWRIRHALPKGAQAAVEVVLQRPRLTSVQLAGQSREALIAYARTGGIDPKAAAALEKLAALQGEVDRLDRLVKEAEAERGQIAKDQERLRQNLTSVPAGGDLAKRYLDAMKTQEDRLDALRAAEADARAKLKTARDALADAIQKTEV